MAEQSDSTCFFKQPEMPATVHGRTWKKILYIDQSVPDNYVPASFLTEMKKNLYLREYTYWGLVLSSGRVTQQISSVAAFVASYVLFSNGHVEPFAFCLWPTVLTAACCAVTFGAAHARASPGAARARNFYDVLAGVRTAGVFALSAIVLSPILMTLTDSISTDTVYAMTAAMLLVHLLARDYDDSAPLASDSTSFNAGVFASVCLASRLPSAVHTFGLVVLSVQMLALWPQAVRRVRHSRRSPDWADVAITTTVALAAGLALLHVAPIAVSVLFAGILAFVTFVCPWWLLQLQPFKDNIYGPWDEATILE